MTASAPASRTVTVRAPAKVNLDLRVSALRPDGYHDLSTVFMAVSLFDEVSVTADDEWSLAVAGPYAGLVPTGAENLVVRAARLLADHAGADEPTLAVRIGKEIPVAAGMAGGSADAAAALVACDHLWGLRLERDELTELAAQLGSDVPFALHGGIAIGSGRGEQLAPVLAQGTFYWVFAVHEDGLSTPSVYAEFDRLQGRRQMPKPTPSPAMMSALRSGDSASLGRALGNDLQEAAISLRPDLQQVLDAGLEYGALGGIVCGSGPTVAFLAESSDHALDLCVALTASGVAREVKRAKGPVPGAHAVTPVVPG